MKYEFIGLIKEAYEWGEILIGDECISEWAEEFNAKIVKLTYYISNSPIDTTNAVERMLTTFYEGICDADAAYCSGTSITGTYARNDELHVGGHDIIEELTSHIGKYCYLEIEMEAN